MSPGGCAPVASPRRRRVLRQRSCRHGRKRWEATPSASRAGSPYRPQWRPAVRRGDRSRCPGVSAESARRQTRRQLPSAAWPRTSTTTKILRCLSGLRRSIEGLDGAPEWPALRSMLPNMAGRRVVDLGCGFGWFSRWAAQAGAASVLGIDLSANMLERAVADTDEIGSRTGDRISKSSTSRPARSTLRTARWRCTTSRIFDSFLPVSISRWSPAGCSSSRSSIRSTAHPRSRIRHRLVGSCDMAAGSVPHGRTPNHRLAGTRRRQAPSHDLDLPLDLQAAGFVLEHFDEWAPTPRDRRSSRVGGGAGTPAVPPDRSPQERP